MASTKIDPTKENRNRGIYVSRSRRVIVDTDWDEQSSFIQTLTAGNVVWYNKFTQETGIAFGEAGQWLPLCATNILSTGTVGVTPENTTSTSMIWYATSDNLGREDQ